jgi:hypothetical protein
VSGHDPAASAAALRPALARLLRPLVRLLIRRGITLPVLINLLREIYVDVARRDLLSDKRAQTDSRISLLTGIHRKELRRQRIAQPEPAEPASLPRSSQIIARWLGGPPWSAPDGNALPLRRSGPEGEPSFDALVAAVTRDLRARTVLDEWLSEGVVRIDEQDRVVLNAAAYLPPPSSPEQLHYFGRNLHDHMAAAVANVLAEDRPPYLDRSVHYDGLTPAQAEELATLARNAAERLLVEVNRASLARLGDAPPAPAPTRRVNLGVYLYEEDEPVPEHKP